MGQKNYALREHECVCLCKRGGDIPCLLEGEAMVAVSRPGCEEDGESQTKDICLTFSQAVVWCCTKHVVGTGKGKERHRRS